MTRTRPESHKLSIEEQKRKIEEYEVFKRAELPDGLPINIERPKLSFDWPDLGAFIVSFGYGLGAAVFLFIYRALNPEQISVQLIGAVVLAFTFGFPLIVIGILGNIANLADYRWKMKDWNAFQAHFHAWFQDNEAMLSDYASPENEIVLEYWQRERSFLA